MASVFILLTFLLFVYVCAAHILHTAWTIHLSEIYTWTQLLCLLGCTSMAVLYVKYSMQATYWIARTNVPNTDMKKSVCVYRRERTFAVDAKIQMIRLFLLQIGFLNNFFPCFLIFILISWWNAQKCDSALYFKLIKIIKTLAWNMHVYNRHWTVEKHLFLVE